MIFTVFTCIEMPVNINNRYDIFELLLGTSVKEIVISLKLRYL